MEQKSQLETALKDFETDIERVPEKLSLNADLDAVLDTALHAALSSFGPMDFFYKDELKNRKVYSGYATQYRRLANLCLRKFQTIMPGLNGQKIHLILLSEHMEGRMESLDEIYKIEMEYFLS